MELDTAFQESLFADEEEEQENELVADAGNTEFVIFLIDAGPDMLLTFEGKGGEQSYLDAVMDCVVENLKSRIISRDSDRVGICFYNTKRKRNPQESEAVYVFKDPERLSAVFIKDVAGLKENFDNEIGSQKQLGSHAIENPLYNSLWVSQALLRSSTKNISKIIHLFTNNDDPFGDAPAAAQADMRRTTIQRAKDAQDLGITIEVHALNRPGEEFNRNIFYIQMDQAQDDGDESRFTITEARSLKDLFGDMRRKVMKKRVARRLTLTITPGTEIGLQCFVMLRSSAPGATTWVEAHTNTEMKSERSFICADTGALMNDAVTKRVQPIGSRKVIITPDEMHQIKKTEVQLQLLGFKSLYTLKDYHNLQPSTFVYPDEQGVSGSTTAFIALHQAMLKHEKYAVAFYGRMSYPRLVALVPQKETVKNNEQIQPPGLNMIYLPYSDDIRPAEKLHTCSPGSPYRATPDQVRLAATLMQKLRLVDFSLLDIRNPALQRHYAALQAIALDEPEVPELEDTTLPEAKGLARASVVNAVRAFKDDVYGVNHDEEEAAKAEALAEGSLASKKRKAAVEAAITAADGINWEELADTGKLKELTIQQLRPYLLAHDLAVSGKKEILVNRILAHMRK